MALSGRTFVVDGSNAVHMLFGPLLDRAEANAREREMAEVLSHWLSRENAEIELIFDGGWRPVIDGGGRMRILFSEGGSADAVILERVRALRYARQRVTVVTRDGELAKLARAEEAKILSPERLWAMAGEDR